MGAVHPPELPEGPRPAHSVSVRHNFETAHRIPHLVGKCVNLHGHSWWMEATVTAPLLDRGTVVEFGAFKGHVRAWIDTYLDHGAMLGADDPLAGILAEHRSKVFRFGASDPGPAERFAVGLPHPTVEAVAELLARVVGQALRELSAAAGAFVSEVVVSETHVNTAGWRHART
ncbi:6-pyruvoyl trahydropterin synthase family protein [Streptomyces sp. NPDC087428]|uniref:6-pyruvoyl trahydropterin synthase family protein n=1 Tax=Streptomyces sp. NPDC087428 TaxID=3365788 RepID=UPI00381D01A4